MHITHQGELQLIYADIKATFAIETDRTFAYRWATNNKSDSFFQSFQGRIFAYDHDIPKGLPILKINMVRRKFIWTTRMQLKHRRCNNLWKFNIIIYQPFKSTNIIRHELQKKISLNNTHFCSFARITVTQYRRAHNHSPKPSFSRFSYLTTRNMKHKISTPP